MTDILLNIEGQPVTVAGVDFSIVSGRNELLQEIKNEAITQEGDLFYDSTYGWSLLDFKNTIIGDLDRLQIEQRIKTKMQKYNEVNLETVEINVYKEKEFQDILQISITFTTKSDDEISLIVSLDRIKAEVTASG